MSKRTDSELLAIARQYQTKKDWSKKDQASMQMARRRGPEFFARCTEHMKVLARPIVTKEECIASALRYETRTDWFYGDKNNYAVAQRHSWLDECCAHMGPPKTNPNKNPIGYWTFERCLEDFMACLAAGGGAREWGVDWPGGASFAAHKNGWTEKIYEAAGYEKKEEIWTLDACKQDALKYQTRADWDRANTSAYQKAYRKGWLDECCAHMERMNGHDNNAVYSWIVVKAPDHVVMPLPGYHLVKSGVTSQTQGDKRPRNTMRDNQMQGEIIAVCDTGEGDALYFEEVLLSLGVQPVFPDIEGMEVDGKTEMRLVSDAELEEIRSLLGAQESALAMAA